MTALNKQALRVLAVALDGDDWHAEGNSVYGGRYDVGDNVCYDHIASCESVNGESPHADFISAANPATVLALLDENLQLQRDKDSLEAAALAMRDDMREAREKLEAAEKRIADLQVARDKCFLSGLKTGWEYGIADDTEGYNREIADAQAVIDRAAGIGVKGE
ncbi:ead/Ea22-like family protein [Citrobacter portucalensis]